MELCKTFFKEEGPMPAVYSGGGEGGGGGVGTKTTGECNLVPRLFISRLPREKAWERGCIARFDRRALIHSEKIAASEREREEGKKKTRPPPPPSILIRLTHHTLVPMKCVRQTSGKALGTRLCSSQTPAVYKFQDGGQFGRSSARTNVKPRQSTPPLQTLDVVGPSGMLQDVTAVNLRTKRGLMAPVQTWENPRLSIVLLLLLVAEFRDWINGRKGK